MQFIDQELTEIDRSVVSNGRPWTGIDTRLSLAALADGRYADKNAGRSAWGQTLSEVLKAGNRSATLLDRKKDQLLIPGSPLPFEEVLLPFVCYAQERLTEKTALYSLFEKAAQRELEQSLLQWLSFINSFSMVHEFSIYRAVHQNRLRRWVKQPEKEGSKTGYQAFVQHLLQDCLTGYFDEYPVLARLIGTAIEQWINGITELTRRFTNDEALIRKTFNQGNPLGKITHVKTSLSDRHNGGQTVMVLEFESGRQLVYKPRNIAIEESYNALLQRLNEMEAPVEFKTFRVISRKNYGWAEFVAETPLTDPAAAKNYYTRAGGMLCLVYVLGATDLHYENLIRCGDFPVLIDLETLLHPIVHDHSPAGQKEDATTKAKKRIIDSVLRTSLLPYWQFGEGNGACDVSGLGKFMSGDFHTESTKWRYVNTDRMQVRKEKMQVSRDEKMAGYPGGKEWELDQFANEIMQGFKEMYIFLKQNQECLLNSLCWRSLAKEQVRFVFRPTMVYLQLQQNLVQPGLLKNSNERSAYLSQVLYNNSVAASDTPLWQPLIQEERVALESMDIPHFTTGTNTSALCLVNGGSIRNYFSEPSFITATNRLRNLNEQDLKCQLAFIQSAVSCSSARENHISVVIEKPDISTNDELLTKDHAIKRAVLIADCLNEKAVVGNDGSITWIAQKFYPDAKRFQLEPISSNLYDGNTGIALFFAAIYKLTQETRYKDLALRTLQIPSELIYEGDTFSGSIGGCTGLGSIGYGLLKAGLLTGEEKLLHTSRKAFSLVSKEMIGQDKNYDVISGAAGTILALLALYKHHPDQQLFDTLLYAGDHLLKNRTPTPSGFRAWKTLDQTALTGFSHGAAGIAFALLQLYKFTNLKQYKEAALEAIAYERTWFDEKEKNWEDIRNVSAGKEQPNGEKKFMCAWCHGAAGIGLARIAALEILDTQEIRADIQSAVETTKRYLGSGTDHLCCGLLGRLELLLAAGVVLADKELLCDTFGKAGAMVKLADKHGDFRYHPQIGFTPGFFQGISGIGYELLRITHPGILPSVLLLG